MKSYGFLAVAPSIALGATASASANSGLTMHILDGRTGKPIHGIRIYVSFDGKPNEINQILGRNGALSFDGHDHKTIEVTPVGTVSCGEQRTGQPKPSYSLQEVVTNGYVSRNECGRYSTESRPGELVIYVRYATQWELFRN